MFNTLIKISLVLQFAMAATGWLMSEVVAQSPANSNSGTEGRPVRVACVGDSITYGDGIPDRDHNSYPAILGKLLGTGYEVRNFGVNGATLLKAGDLPYWNCPQFQEAKDFQPDLVVIKLGTNDSKPRNWNHRPEFVSDLKDMIVHFASLPSHPRLWLCLPAPVYKDRWGIREDVVDDEVIPAIRQVAREMELPVIDVHTALLNRRSYFPDGIHPDASGAALMAATIRQELMEK